MDNESKQHYKMYKSGKQWVYTGLATITMISGMGATPVILADELIADKTEATTKDDKDVTADKTEVKADEKDADNKVENAPEVVAETPKPLPDNKVTLAPTKTEAPVAVASTQESIVKKSKATKPASKEAVVNTESAKTEKAKDSRAAYTLTAADFDVSADGKTINGFNSSFTGNTTNVANWNGDLTFPTGLESVTSIADNAFNGQSIPANVAIMAKVTTISLGNLKGLQTIGVASFESIPNLTTVNLTDLPALTGMGTWAFGYNGNLTTVNIANLPALSAISKYAFVNSSKMSSLTFGTGLNALTVIGDYAFDNCFSLPNLDLGSLTNLKTIAAGAFANSRMQTLTLQGLHNLTTIAESAFSSGNMAEVKLLDLPALTTIGDYAFNLNFYFPGATIPQNNYFQKLTVGGLTSLTADGIGDDAFENIDSGGVVVPNSGEADLAIAKIFVTKINNAYLNNFADRVSTFSGTDGPVWYIQAKVTYNFVDRNGDTIAPSSTDARPGVVRIGDVLDGTDPNTGYASVPAITISGYTNDPTATTKANFENGTTITHLDPEQTITYVYDKDVAKTGSVTYKYIDQDGKVILVDANGVPIDPYYKGGNEGDTYNPKDGVPLIPGYGKPEWVSGTETGVIGDGDITIVYRYHKKADPITIYRVDTNDTPLADPEVVTDTYVDDILDLGAKQRTFSGYDFIELYNSAPVVQKAMTDFTWLNDHSSIGTKLTFEANAGRNYKFVYGKKATTPTTPTTPPTLPVTGETPTTPAKNPSTSGNKTPGGLPVTGDDKNPSNKSGSNTTNPGTVTNISNATPSVNSTPTGALPKSGNVVNRLLPAIGATLLASLIGLFAFRKQRK